jgi:hypothetical protein
MWAVLPDECPVAGGLLKAGQVCGQVKLPEIRRHAETSVVLFSYRALGRELSVLSRAPSFDLGRQRHAQDPPV